ncbi:hypothetical protein Barb6_01080 [Bacteroidales bacterium Barb6]|nr:hypothetical protein Barb6_01080 [Bacteroidales bacterium Barb6]
MDKHYFVRNGSKVVCMYFSVMETVAKYFAGIFHHAKIVTKCFACIFFMQKWLQTTLQPFSCQKIDYKVLCNHFSFDQTI